MTTRSAAILGLTLIVAACGSPGGDPNTGPDEPATTGSTPQAGAAPTARNPAVAEEVVLQVGNSQQFGPHLTDGDGRAVYMFSRDSSETSLCEGRCLQDWPPMLQKGALVAGSGIDQQRIGTLVRDGGLRQVTYAGRPLYYYVAAQASRTATAQNIRSYDGSWNLVSPDGEPNRTARQ